MQRPQTHSCSSSSLVLGAALLAAAAAGACTEGGTGGIIYKSRSTTASAASNSVVRVAERWVLFQADEFTTGPAGTDLNGDGDELDLVAFVVDMATEKETNLGVATDDLAILGEATSARLLMVVSEGADGTDWNDDGDTDDVVLLSVQASQAATADLDPVATLSGSGQPLVLDGDRAWFVEDPEASGGLAIGDSAINYVEADGSGGLTAPVRMPQMIADPLGTVLLDVLAAPRLVALDAGLLFFTMDETAEEPVGGGGVPGVNLNGGLASLLDDDRADTAVLGVLDTTDAAAVALNVNLAVDPSSIPVRAIETGTDQEPDRLAAFLVNEAAQGDTNLNIAAAPDLPGGWDPAQCVNPDADTADNVLFYLSWEDWLADPLTGRGKNTGLAGHDRVLATLNGEKRFVATLSLELDAECDLNDDGDSDDDVFRYAPVGGGTAFVVSPQALLAVEGVAGGTLGATDLGERWVAVISEADNDAEFNGDEDTEDGYKSDDLVAWLDPGKVTNSTTQPWVFDHSPNNGIQAAGCDWMAERPERDRLPVTYLESVHGSSINTGGDDDTEDSIPAWARFDPIDDLDFPGPPVAGDAGNAGTVLTDNNLSLYRVDELADNRDWNGDGDKDDMVLFRTTTSSLQNSNYLGVLNSEPRPAMDVGGTIGAAYLADESMAGIDFNEDGDLTDLVLRWFRIG
jgi:hypothetical protein